VALWQRIKQARQAGLTIYPPADEVFSAFGLTDFAQVKVVILGQDPYHGAGQAHGLAFSVKPEVAIPPSLRNIYRELASDVPGFVVPQHGFLQHWAAQGVLLLNVVLTVQENQANSHANWGWEHFTDRVVAQLNQHRNGLVFMLWGSYAQKKGAMIDRQRHLVLQAPHPSPLSAHRGFFGCKHFSQANAYLQQQGLGAIDWQV
jgi:uracil-DNA glycosylase